MLELHTVKELVQKNYASAYVLDCYGIEFFRCLDKTIGEVCLQHGVNTQQVCHNLLAAKQTSTIDITILQSYPVEIVIEYLKHAHHIFVKKSLPYMSKLIGHLEPDQYQNTQLIHDLKLGFPLFAEDFIHHIYEEEDEFFHYVLMMSKVCEQQVHFNKIYDFMESISLTDLADDHENADDEMRGIRKLTCNYTLGVDSDLHLKTIYSELMQFEKELVFHANVENEVLFPKAIELESRIKDQLAALRNMN